DGHQCGGAGTGARATAQALAQWACSEKRERAVLLSVDDREHAMSDETLQTIPPDEANEGGEPSPETPARQASVLEVIGGGVALLSVVAALLYVLHQRDYQPAVRPSASESPVVAAVADRESASSEPVQPVLTPSPNAPSGRAWQPVPLSTIAR